MTAARDSLHGRLGQGRVLRGRYQLTRLLGQGATASVWQGRDLECGRTVAVKILHRAGVPDPAGRLRFDREAQMLRTLCHPGIVTGYDAGTDGPDAFQVLEFVDGSSLARVLAAGPMPVDTVVDLAGQIAAALAVVHEAGIVHRDVKPQNLLLTGDGTVKLCDFGIASMAANSRRPGLTAFGQVVGSVKYMSPEQAFGLPLNGRSDLYALGCVLYAMLAGAPPFTGGEDHDILRQHVADEPFPVAGYRPDIPVRLAELVTRLLAKKPQHRPRDARQVHAELASIRAALAGQAPAPVAACTTTRVERVAVLRFPAFRVACAAAAAAVALGFLAGMGVAALDTTDARISATGAEVARPDVPAEGAPQPAPVATVPPEGQQEGVGRKSPVQGKKASGKDGKGGSGHAGRRGGK